MDLIATGIAVLLFLLLVDIARNTPAVKLWLAHTMKRPAVMAVFPEGKVELYVLKKGSEYSKGFYLPELNTAYSRTPGSVLLLNGKIPLYIVYVPYGKTIHPAWAKALAIAREMTGEKHVRDIFQKLSEMEDSGVVQQAAVVYEQLKDKQDATDEEKVQLQQAAEVLATYNRYKHAAELIGQIFSTLSPQVFEELIADADASAYAQMIKDAETKERVRWADYVKKLGLTNTALLIFFAGIIGIIIIWAIVGGGHAPNIIHTGAQVASKVVEANTTTGATVGM